MKKVCYLLFILVSLTGCSATYTLNIDKDFNLKEEILVKSEDKGDTYKIKEFSSIVPVDYEIDDYETFKKKIKGVGYYNVLKNSDRSKLKMNYIYDVNKFNNNIVARSCYEYVTSSINSERLLLSTSRKFLCFDKYENLSSVSVRVKSKYKLMNTNADKIEGNTYIWNITRDNYENKNLYLELDRNMYVKDTVDKVMEINFVNMFVISIIILIIGYFVYKKIREIGLKRNEV